MRSTARSKNCKCRLSREGCGRGGRAREKERRVGKSEDLNHCIRNAEMLGSALKGGIKERISSKEWLDSICNLERSPWQEGRLVGIDQTGKGETY